MSYPDVDRLIRWVQQVLGTGVGSVQQLTRGNARLTFQLDLAGTPARRVILRHEAGSGPLADTPFSLHREALACRALKNSNLPVPEVLAEDRSVAALLTQCLPGGDDPGGLAMDDYLQCLGRLHALDVAMLDLPGFHASTIDEIGIWREILAAKSPGVSAVAGFGFERLLELAPSSPGRVALCHGDAGPGNYLQENGRVTAMLDWEMAHIGDPLDDLAWITIRAVQTNVDLGDYRGRVAQHYGASIPAPGDLDRFHFWQAFGFLRMLVICLAAAAKPRAGRERLLQMMLVPVLEFQLLQAIATLEGLTLVDYLDAAALEATALPVELLQEASADIHDTVLPRFRGEPMENRVKRIRNLLSQLAAAGDSSPRTNGRLSLDALAEQTAARLHWLPAGASLARRPLASLAPVS